MLVAGDEGGRTQGGNNNAYCLDDATTWVDWTPTRVVTRLTEFTRDLLTLRAQHPVFRQERFFSGGPLGADGRPDVAWFRADGAELTDGDWHNTAQTTLGMLLNGDALTRRGPHGETLRDDSFLLLLHAGPFPVEFHLPRLDWAAAYLTVLATEVKPPGGPTPPRQPGATVAMPPNSAVLLRVEGFVGPPAKTSW
jgi:isoamylase